MPSKNESSRLRMLRRLKLAMAWTTARSFTNGKREPPLSTVSSSTLIVQAMNNAAG